MSFVLTEEQLEQIKDYLLLYYGKKDTQLTRANLPLSGQELLAIIQNGQNKVTAIDAILGVKHPYLPDEEDLTSVNNGSVDLLKFKDKTYAPLAYSGMGRKILRKNMVNGVNILTQEMMPISTEEGIVDPGRNTVYIIQYDYDLANNIINIPSDSILLFIGGSFSNGTLVGNNTRIVAPKTAIFNGITISGTWNVPDIYSAWFSDIVNENKLRQLINLTSDNPNNVYIDEGDYLIAVEQPNYGGIIFEHSNIYIHNSGTIRLKPNDHYGYYAILLMGDNITWDGGEFIGDAKEHDYTTYQDTQYATHEWGRGIVAHGENIIIRNVKSSLCTGDAFNVKANNTIIQNVVAEKSRRQGITGAGTANIIIENFNISNIGDFTIDGVQITGTNPKAAIDIEPRKADDGTINIVIKNGIIDNCKRGIDVFKSNIESAYNQNVVIQNIYITGVQFGIRFSRLERGSIQNVYVEFSDIAFKFENYKIKSSYVCLDNVECVGENTGKSMGIRYYYTDVVVTNSRFTSNVVAMGDHASSVLSCNKCDIIQDYPITIGKMYFDKCNISNSIDLGFTNTRPMYATGERIALYLTDCYIKQESPDLEYTIYCSGNNNVIRLNNCYIQDASTRRNVVARVRSNCTIEFIDTEFYGGYGTFDYRSEGNAVERYIRLYQSGGPEERPVRLSVHAAGHTFFDKKLLQPIYWDGTRWIFADGKGITWPLVYTLTNITASNQMQPEVDQPYETVLTADEGYTLPHTISVSMGSTNLVQGTDFVYNDIAGTVEILGIGGTGGVTDELTINATAA